MAVGEIVAGSPPALRAPVPPALEWLELAAADSTARFIGLTTDLGRPFDSSGNGKRITPAHAYAGMGAALAWAAASPRAETFADRWEAIRAPAEPCHYVSLGPGDGRKDGVLLADLSRTNRDLCYLPVDTAEELLHLKIRGLIRRLRLPTDRIMSLPWDFSLRETAAALRRLLDELFGPTPVLFSLLGNTIAGFDADADVLGVVASVLRPDDRLLLEVEVTAELSPRMAALAADEHAAAYGAVAAATLRHHTGIHAADVEVIGEVEAGRALVVKSVHRSGEDTRLTLPNGATVPFRFDDTVRLGLSRKYSPEGLAELVATAGLDIVDDVCAGTGGPFGLALLVLARQPTASPFSSGR